MDNGNEKKTALEFETVSLGGFVFETEDAPQKSSYGVNNEASGEDNALRDPAPDVTESFELSFAENYAPKNEKEEKISDAPKVRRTYVPRFTEASERYRSAAPTYRSVPKLREDTPVTTSAGTALDPTAELDDEREVKKVVVSTGTESENELLDESIKIFKFQNTEEKENKKEIPVANKADKASDDSEIPRVPAIEPEEPTAEHKADEPVPETPSPIVPDWDKLVPTPLGKLSEGEEPRGSRENPECKSTPREYNALNERDGFKDRFLDALMSVKIRLVAIVLIMLSLVASEIVFLTVSPAGMVGFLAGGGVLVDLLFSSALFALAVPELYKGIRVLARGKIIPELVIPISYAIILVYSLTAALAGEPGARYMHFSLPLAVTVLYSVLASYFRISAEFKSFKLISRGREMWVLDKRFTRTLERENIALDGAVDEYRSKLARAFRTSFVSDFKSNSERVHENSANTVTVIAISLAAAILSGCITLFLSDSIAPVSRGLEASLAVFFFTVPAFSVLIHKLPLNRLIKSSASKGHTFIGESAVMDTAEIDVIAYDDVEMLGDVAIKKMHLYGKVYNTERALSEMYSLFSSVGGPLLGVFSDALAVKCAPASSVTLFDDGIVGFSDGCRIMAGSYEFMLRNNVKIPDDDGKILPDTTDGVKVMYGARDGEVYVKFFIKYSFTDGFLSVFSDFKKYGIVPLVYTRDPNLDRDLLCTLTDGEDRVRVFKLHDMPAPEEVYPRISSDAVTLAEKISAPEMLTLARDYRTEVTLLSFIELLCMLVGASASSVLSLLFVDRLSILPSLVYLLWQLIPLAVFSVIPKIVRRLKERNKE